MKSSKNNQEIKIGDQFYYWKVVELVGPATARCLCTGCDKVVKELWFCKLLKQSSRSCGCKNNEFRKQKALQKYGVENVSQAEVIKERKKQTTLSNHGVLFPMQSEELQSKSKQTLLDKWGVEHNSQHESIKQRKKAKFILQDQDVVESRKQKFKQLYGKENYLSVPSNRDQIRHKIKQLYGVENPSQSELVKAKKRQTSLLNYNTDHPQQSLDLRSKKLYDLNQEGKAAILSSGEYLSLACDQVGIVNKSHAYNLLRLFGEETVIEYLKNYRVRESTDIESLFVSLMKPYFNNIQKHNKKPIESNEINYRPDFRLVLDGKVLYVNVDGLYYHSELMIEDKHYHFNMRKTFEQHNLRLMQFRADELVNKPDLVVSLVLNYFGVYVQKISARACELVVVNKAQADKFFIKNHLMGTHSAFKSWGLVYKNEVVCCIAIREFDKHIEICRFGSLNNTSVRGGFSKLLNKISLLYKKPIISYCDLRYASGASYHKLGFNLASTSQGWQWTNLKQVFSRYYCRASMDSRSLSERDYAKELKVVKIFDAGQAKFCRP